MKLVLIIVKYQQLQDRLQESCTPVVGPKLHHKHRGPVQDSNSDTMSASSVTECSRNQYYEEILGYRPSSLHEVGFGMLLLGSLHHSFDHAEWSLFPDPKETTSCMYSTTQVYASIMGKIFTKRAFG
ncbi:uncharacterized protein FA14DRAFT_96556 [Meira miltonrushii]|uniref:Uncharacterized protein n=1 Tax=Meira miltonrushii TaxID=1280837 RepID=A0A316V1D0_9BASI|nr:uncharacterized protein FA14DRAFT_96556 [Meira miltonrushii]PWN31359.1 hypothetical protein FA14DRAFT_96556 [Meira miltonrushii]